MKKKDLIKEDWIEFEDETNLEEELPNIELGRRVFESTKYCRMFHKTPNSYLEKRFNNLSTFIRELENIRNISIIRKANINNKNELINNYLIIEDKYGPNVILDLNNGIDESYRFKHLFLTTKSKIEELYHDIGRSETMKLAKIKNVYYYPKALLVNDLTKAKVLKGYILEITDMLNNKLYVDCYTKNLFYSSNNYSIINDYKRIELFNKDSKLDIPNHILDFKYNISNIFMEVIE